MNLSWFQNNMEVVYIAGKWQLRKLGNNVKATRGKGGVRTTTSNEMQPQPMKLEI